MKIGLERSELESLCGGRVGARKITTRELGMGLGLKDTWGSTTVASTMWLAKLANIRFFVTGGTGGVHRGYEETMDCSADLTELARTNVTVVSAGVKSILDIPRTLERLESLGVTVGVFGSDEFPAFFSPNSGCRAPITFDSYESVARTIMNNEKLGLPGGLLLACPNPSPLPNVDEAVAQAVSELSNVSIEGKDVTPHLLSRVAELTGGESMASNIAAVENNSVVGSGVAKAYQAMVEAGEEGKGREDIFHVYLDGAKDVAPSRPVGGSSSRQEAKVGRGGASEGACVVMGGSVMDILAKPSVTLEPGTSNPGSVLESPGGVARNIVETIGKVAGRKSFPNVEFFTAVGRDSRGNALLDGLSSAYHPQSSSPLGEVCVVDDQPTATYLALMDSSNDLHAAVASTSIFSNIPCPPPSSLQTASFFVFDANAGISTISSALKACGDETLVVFEPTSNTKCFDVAKSGLLKRVDDTSPIRAELAEMCKALGLFFLEGEDEDAAAVQLLREMNKGGMILLTSGENGVTKVTDEGVKRFGVDRIVEPVNSNAAGDSFIGGFVAHLLTHKAGEVPPDFDAAIKSGIKVATQTVLHDGGVAEHYTLQIE